MRGKTVIIRSRCVLLVAALVLLASLALGQAERGVTIRSPRSPGSEVSPSRLHNSAPAAASPSYGGDGGPLREASRDDPARPARRSAPSAPAGEALPALPSAQRQVYRTLAPPTPVSLAGLTRRPLRAGGAVEGGATAAPRSLAMLEPYLDAVRNPASSRLSPDRETVSLVPAAAGLLRQYMQAGESHLQAGRHLEAYGQYSLASILQPRLADPLLGMALARAASAEHSYAPAAIHLQGALRLMPALPRAKFRPARLLGAENWQALLGRLEARAGDGADDVEALMVLGCLHHFDGSHARAAQTLARAESARLLQRGKARVDVDPLLETIRAFRAAAGEAEKAAPPAQPAQPAQPIAQAGPAL